MRSGIKIGPWRVFSTMEKFSPVAKRHFSDSIKHKNAWEHPKAATPKIAEHLENDVKLPFGTNFTLLSPKNITRQIQELRDLWKALGTRDYHDPIYRTPNNLIVLKPQRLALHHVGAIVATKIQTADEAEFVEICKKFTPTIQADIMSRQKFFDAIVSECLAKAHELVAKNHKTEESDDPEIQKFLHLRRAIQIRQIELGFDPALIDELTTKIITDDFIRHLFNEHIDNITNELIEGELRLKKLTELTIYSGEEREQVLWLPQHSSHERLTKIFAGGIASGKSSIAKRFLAEMKERYGLTLSDFARISTDTFRLLLLNDPSIGEDHALKSSLTHDEARMILDLSIQKIDKKVKESGYAPHVFMEAVSPTDVEIAVGSQLGGGVRISVTHYPEEKAVEGNYLRFLETKDRLPPPSAVLGSQKIVSQNMPRIFNTHRGKDVVMTLCNTYKIIHESSKKTEVIAIFHCQKEKIVILDIAQMLEFVKKSHIDTAATCPKTIYPDTDKIKLDNMIQDFFAAYGDNEVAFVMPNTEVTNIHDYEKHAYVTYDPKCGLIIHDKTMFDKMREDAATGSLFTSLIKHHAVKRAANTESAIYSLHNFT